MALLATLAFGGQTWNLICEAVDHTFNRVPAQAGLPGLEGTEAGVQTIDLGVCTQQISLNGIVNSVSTDGGTSDPSKSDLEEVVLTWWQYGADPNALAQLTLPGGTTYSVSIKFASFHMDGALEDRWIYSITFLVSVPTS